MRTRSLRRLILATALLGLVAFLPPSAATAGTPAPPAPGAYAALGDSFSSGEGTFDYDPSPEAQACHRGPDAWPRSSTPVRTAKVASSAARRVA